MKIAATLTVLTLTLGTAGFAYADSMSNYPVDTTTATISTLTHAQVQQELQHAKAEGLVTINENTAYPVLAQNNEKTRAEVLADLHNAQAAGLMQIGQQANYPGFSA